MWECLIEHLTLNGMTAIVTVSPRDSAAPDLLRVGPEGNWCRPRWVRFAAILWRLSDRELPGVGGVT